MSNFRNSRSTGPEDVDLSRFDADFASAPTENRARGPVPDGKYHVNVERVEFATARSSGNTMLKWMLRIIGPTHAGQVLWRNNVLATRENVAWLKADLHICGLDLQKLSDLNANLGKLLEVRLEVTKRTKGDNENVYLNRRIEMDEEDTDAGGPSRDPWGRSDDIPF